MKVLITPRFSIESRTYLQTQGFDLEDYRSESFAEANLKETQVLVIRTDLHIDEAVLERAPNLKLILTVTNGFDHIDVKAAEKRGVEVAHVPEGNANSAAELTLYFLLALARRGVELDRHVRRLEWDRDPLRGVELSGKILGIVGFGRIGRLVAQRAAAFGMEIWAYDPYAPADNILARTSSLEEVLCAADFLTLHVPWTKETHHMVQRGFFEQMKEGSFLVNTSRGAVVSESDLIWALENEILTGAALDVFESEPLPKNSRLLKTRGLILSPHCGANTFEAFARGSRRAAEVLLEFQRTGKVTNGRVQNEPWY